MVVQVAVVEEPGGGRGDPPHAHAPAPAPDPAHAPHPPAHAPHPPAPCPAPPSPCPAPPSPARAQLGPARHRDAAALPAPLAALGRVRGGGGRGLPDPAGAGLLRPRGRPRGRRTVGGSGGHGRLLALRVVTRPVDRPGVHGRADGRQCRRPALRWRSRARPRALGGAGTDRRGLAGAGLAAAPGGHRGPAEPPPPGGLPLRGCGAHGRRPARPRHRDRGDRIDDRRAGPVVRLAARDGRRERGDRAHRCRDPGPALRRPGVAALGAGPLDRGRGRHGGVGCTGPGRAGRRRPGRGPVRATLAAPARAELGRRVRAGPGRSGRRGRGLRRQHAHRARVRPPARHLQRQPGAAGAVGRPRGRRPVLGLSGVVLGVAHRARGRRAREVAGLLDQRDGPGAHRPAGGRAVDRGAARGGPRRGGDLRRDPPGEHPGLQGALAVPALRVRAGGRHPRRHGVAGHPRGGGDRHRAVPDGDGHAALAAARRDPGLRPRDGRDARRRRLRGRLHRRGPDRVPLRRAVVLRQRRGLPGPGAGCRRRLRRARAPGAMGRAQRRGQHARRRHGDAAAHQPGPRTCRTWDPGAASPAPSRTSCCSWSAPSCSS